VLETFAETVESILGAPRAKELEASTQGQDDRTDSDDGENPEPGDPGNAQKRPGCGVLQHDAPLFKEKPPESNLAVLRIDH